MGFRFRKSINLGGGFKVNLSKSGVGYSWGTKGVRYTKTATGKNRTTISIPGTGISHITESGGIKRSTTPRRTKTSCNLSASTPNSTENGGNNMVWVRFIICLFFGYLGVHKFMEKKIGMGILYLFTMGLLGLGWIYDCIKYLIIAIKHTNTREKSVAVQQENRAELNTAYPPEAITPKHSFPVKKILLWVLTGFLGLMALAFLPHISGIISLTAAVIVIPIEKWQNLISRFLQGKAKTIIVTVMTIVAFLATPTAESPEVERSTPNTVVTDTTEAVDEMITLPTIAVTESVTEPPAVEKITFDGNSYIVGIGRTVEIPFVLYPENATSSTLEVSCDNAENASLSFEKKDEHIVQVTGLLSGEVTITLKSGELIVATKTITIVEVIPDGMTIKTEPEAPQVGSSGVFTVVYDPVDVTNQNVTWHSDAPEVIKVNEDGSFEALSIGKATITATHESCMTGTVLIEVLPIQVDQVKISTNWEAGKVFCKGDSMTLVAEISPEDATDKSLTWTSSDESVATVSDKGVVTAVAQGAVVITATASNGKTGTYQITVDPSPQKFRVSITLQMQSNDHVGSNWTNGVEFNDEAITSGTVISIMPGAEFTVRGWAQDNDSNPDYGSYFERLTLTNEMCTSGFTIEGEANVRENGGRYSGHYAVWYVKITFTPVN